MLLQRDSLSQLVYKHAISTVQPESPISFIEAQDEEQPA
jgi:host factor-I protein